MEYKFRLSKIHCAGCAVALEQNLNEIDGVRAEISFVSKQLKLFIDTENPAETLTAVKIAITKFDRSIEIFNFDERFLILLSKLEGVRVGDIDFFIYRKTIFESISLLREIYNAKL